MTQRTANLPTQWTLISVLYSVLASATPVFADLIAYTSFEGLWVPLQKTMYQDTGDKTLDHALSNRPNQPLVNWVQTETDSHVLGFSSFYRNTRNDVGLTDGDYVGVTRSAVGLGAYPDGSQGFQMSDTDGLMITSLDSVDLRGFQNPMISFDLYVAETGWELDDHIRAWATVDGGTTMNLLNTQGRDIDALSVEGVWTTFSANLTGYTMATLAFELDSNAGTESIFIDDIEFTGEVVPVPGAFVLAGLGLSTAWTCLKKRRV